MDTRVEEQQERVGLKDSDIPQGVERGKTERHRPPEIVDARVLYHRLIDALIRPVVDRNEPARREQLRESTRQLEAAPRAR